MKQEKVFVGGVGYICGYSPQRVLVSHNSREQRGGSELCNTKPDKCWSALFVVTKRMRVMTFSEKKTFITNQNKTHPKNVPKHITRDYKTKVFIYIRHIFLKILNS